jgi:hypothetical protein
MMFKNTVIVYVSLAIIRYVQLFLHSPFSLVSWSCIHFSNVYRWDCLFSLYMFYVMQLVYRGIKVLYY